MASNRRCRCGCNPRRESAVAQLFSLGHIERMVILMFIVFAAIAAIGAIPVIGCGFLLRKVFSRRLTLAAALAISCAVIVTISTALYPTPIFWANVPEFDDVYSIFILVPGVLIYQLGRLIGFAVAPSLETVTSFHTASVLPS
jgi:hypothetical protein